MPYILNVSLGAEYSKSFFCACICQKIAKPIDNLHVSVCSLDKYAMNHDHSIGHDSFKSRGQNVRNNKDNRDCKLSITFCYARM